MQAYALAFGYHSTIRDLSIVRVEGEGKWNQMLFRKDDVTDHVRE